MLREVDIEDDVEFDVPADFVEAEGGAERFVDMLLGNAEYDGNSPDEKAFFSRLAQPDKVRILSLSRYESITGYRYDALLSSGA